MIDLLSGGLLIHTCRRGLQVRGVLAAALGVMPGQPLPPLLFEREVATPTQQPQQLLEGAEPDEWLVFDQARHGRGRGRWG